MSEIVQSREILPQAVGRGRHQESLPGGNEIWNEIFRMSRNLVNRQKGRGSVDVGSHESQRTHSGARDRSLES